MFRVELCSDDFHGDSGYVLVASAARAITKILLPGSFNQLTDGLPNRVKAERNAWNLICTGIEAGKLHPLSLETLDVLCAERCTEGIVSFDELVAWGQWCKRFEFVDASMNSEQKNLAYWFGLPIWPLDAACRLVCGADPNNPDQAPLHLPDPATRPEWVNLFHHATADDEVEIIEGKGGARGVKPGQFIAWARSKRCGLDTKFDVLLANKPAAKVEAGAGTNPSGEGWEAQARTIADRLALEKYQRGEREITARNTCNAVATELAKDFTTHGKRGERSPGNVRNVALKGWKFIPQAGTNGTSGTYE